MGIDAINKSSVVESHTFFPLQFLGRFFCIFSHLISFNIGGAYKIGYTMPNSQRVYIGNIPSDARDRDLEKFFKGYGRLNDVVVKNGYGFVEFSDYRDADDAVSDLDGKDMDGGRVRVELAREDPKRVGRRGSRD